MSLRVGVYPGSFDPVTLGHFDIIERGLKIVDHLVIGVLRNSTKSPLFSVEQRVQMLSEVTKDMEHVSVVPFEGLLVDFLKEQKSSVVIRGLRAVTDFEYELQMAQANRSLYPDMETLFLTTRATYSYISSTVVKDILRHGGDVTQFVPASALSLIQAFLQGETYNP